MHAIIEPLKDRVFPASYEFEKMFYDQETVLIEEVEAVELFGDMIARIERWQSQSEHPAPVGAQPVPSQPERSTIVRA